MIPTMTEFYQARRRLAGIVRRTPLERSEWLSERAGCAVYLKLECWQRTRSFKARGAYNAIAALSPDARARGLVAASAGNHGQGVALAGRLLGARAIIFVPASAPETKKARIRSLGARLREIEGIYDDAEAAALEFAAAREATFVHPFADPAVVAGQGTIGLEILDELPDVADVVIPVGGGGLIAGIGSVLNTVRGDALRVHGVQSDRTRSMHASFEAGRAVDAPPDATLADGLAGGVEDASYRATRTVADGIELVSEEAIASAIRSLYRHDGVVAEGAAAVPAAAVAEGRLDLDGPAVLIVSGGNIDGNRLANILAGE